MRRTHKAGRAMKIIDDLFFIPFYDNKEKRRHFKAIANKRRVKLRREAKRVLQGFYAAEQHWDLIISARNRDGGRLGRGDNDKRLWEALFVAFYGEAPASNDDPRWDRLFDPHGYAALHLVEGFHTDFWSARQCLRRRLCKFKGAMRSIWQACKDLYRFPKKHAVP